ncbi:MAG: hypothetical protein HY689_10725 [Chloroflexi bacterium]|nr:hypothetical protein [Chloroflexota bacterium]
MPHQVRTTGKLYRADDGQLVARVSCYLVVSNLGKWDGSLSLLEEVTSVEALWYAGVHDYGLELSDGRCGTITLTPLSLPSLATAGKSYTFQGISLPPGDW